MSLRKVFLTLSAALVVAALLVPVAAAESAPPVATVTSRSGSGFIYAGQAIWHGPSCATPAGMSPEGGDNYACRPPVKLPQPQPQRRPLPIRLS